MSSNKRIIKIILANVENNIKAINEITIPEFLEYARINNEYLK